MRPLELSLLLVLLLTLGVLAVPQLHAVRWIGYVAFLAVLIAIAQMIVEGPRWQMVPAYVLTGCSSWFGCCKAPRWWAGRSTD
jgi:hypothetical protein